MVCIGDDTKEKEEKKVGGIPRGGTTKQIDHARADMTSRLAGIEAKVMCCVPTMSGDHS